MELKSDLTVARLRSMWEQGQITLTDIPEYWSYKNMLNRCYNRNGEKYHLWGGRGIRVYGPWRKDFWEWFAHIGCRPVLPGFAISQDRIDNNGHYWPGNVRWASPSEQGDNRRPELTTGEGHHCAKLDWAKVQQNARLKGSDFASLQEALRIEPAIRSRKDVGECVGNLLPAISV